jgi:predicted glycosyltransferase
VLRAAGVDPHQPYSVIRFVSWKAVHDIKAQGFSLEAKRKLIQALQVFGHVFMTSEQPPPDEFERFRMTLPADQIHHLLAFAQLYIGESATMASESVILGTPAVYLDPYGRGYTDEQEERYGLCSNFHPSQGEQAIARSQEILSSQLKTRPDFQSRVATLHAEKIDVTSLIVNQLTQAV